MGGELSPLAVKFLDEPVLAHVATLMAFRGRVHPLTRRFNS